jgi:hypothetical protein
MLRLSSAPQKGKGVTDKKRDLPTIIHQVHEKALQYKYIPLAELDVALK